MKYAQVLYIHKYINTNEPVTKLGKLMQFFSTINKIKGCIFIDKLLHYLFFKLGGLTINY